MTALDNYWPLIVVTFWTIAAGCAGLVALLTELGYGPTTPGTR